MVISYTTIFSAIIIVIWIFSIWNRIIRKEIRNYFFKIGLFLLMYIGVHQLKRMVVIGSVQDHYLCYFYDVLLTMIPMLCFFVSLYIGQPDEYHLPPKLKLLNIPALMISAMLLTNELHHFVFTELRSSIDYKIGPGFLIFISWVFSMSVSFLISLYSKSRLPGRKRRFVLPYFFLILEVLYILAVFMKARIFIQYEATISIAPALIIVGILESCIQTGLIASNTHYRELFELASIDMKIVDNNFKTILSSSSDWDYSVDVMKQAEKEPVIMPNGMRLSSNDISCGHVFWQEDVSELTKKRDELEYDNEYLQGKNITLQRKYSTAKQRKKLEERNRIYTEVQRQTAGKLSLLAREIDDFAKEKEVRQEKKELLHICTLATYLKRRSNLFLLLESKKQLTTKDLQDCIYEMAQNFQIFGIPFLYSVEDQEDISFKHIIALYDALEEIVEGTMDNISSYYITVQKEKSVFRINLRLSGIKTLPPFQLKNVDIRQEEDKEWYIVVKVGEGDTGQ